MKEPIIFNDFILIVNNFWSIVTNICSEWNSVSVKVNHSGFLYFDTIARREVLGCTADFFLSSHFLLPHAGCPES